MNLQSNKGGGAGDSSPSGDEVSLLIGKFLSIFSLLDSGVKIVAENITSHGECTCETCAKGRAWLVQVNSELTDKNLIGIQGGRE